MLSVMKRKLAEKEEEPRKEPPRHFDPASGKEVNASMVPPHLETRIVSHIPVSSSVSSLSSSDSTLSSSQYPKVEEALTGEPSLSTTPLASQLKYSAHESSPCLTMVAPLPLTEAVDERLQTCTKKRSISVVSQGDDISKESASACQPKKLPRLTEASRPESPPSLSPKTLLLATDKDSSVLSALHVMVRKQIEVFQASEEDLKKPAPGRRIPIQPLQVGLRCIHCKHLKARERKKRAVCYPSAVGRVYHSVSDMKFAHFPCPQMPKELAKQFLELKEESQIQSKSSTKESSSKRSGSANSTAQYYHDSARELGMVDGKGGIYALSSPSFGNFPATSQLQTQSSVEDQLSIAIAQANVLRGILLGNLLPSLALANASLSQADLVSLLKDPSAGATTSSANALACAISAPPHIPSVPTEDNADVTGSSQKSETAGQSKRESTGSRTLLASDSDANYLAPIHCFVRRHVEVFAASEQDLAAPAPGRKKPIVLGQVGLRCIHCKNLPIKDRVKRSVCFPPSVSGVYHAVSNMKFDHFKQCKGMPQGVREEFHKISSGAESKKKSTSRQSNSTAQYYHDSAIRMGLVDTANEGIRLRQEDPLPNPVECTKGAEGACAPGGMEALVLAATDPEVRAAHEQRRQKVSAI